MKLKITRLSLSMAMALCLSFPAWSAPNQPAKTATAITQVFGDEVKLVAVAVEYDTPVKASEVAISDFTVDNRTVTNVYPSSSVALNNKATEGRYVIVELSKTDKNTSLEYRIDMPNATVEDKPKGGTPWKAGDKLSKNIQYKTASATIATQGQTL